MVPWCHSGEPLRGNARVNTTASIHFHTISDTQTQQTASSQRKVSIHSLTEQKHLFGVLERLEVLFSIIIMRIVRFAHEYISPVIPGYKNSDDHALINKHLGCMTEIFGVEEAPVSGWLVFPSPYLLTEGCELLHQRPSSRPLPLSDNTCPCCCLFRSSPRQPPCPQYTAATEGAPGLVLPHS